MFGRFAKNPDSNRELNQELLDQNERKNHSDETIINISSSGSEKKPVTQKIIFEGGDLGSFFLKYLDIVDLASFAFINKENLQLVRNQIDSLRISESTVSNEAEIETLIRGTKAYLYQHLKIKAHLPEEIDSVSKELNDIISRGPLQTCDTKLRCLKNLIYFGVIGGLGYGEVEYGGGDTLILIYCSVLLLIWIIGAGVFCQNLVKRNDKEDQARFLQSTALLVEKENTLSKSLISCDPKLKQAFGWFQRALPDEAKIPEKAKEKHSRKGDKFKFVRP